MSTCTKNDKVLAFPTASKTLLFGKKTKDFAFVRSLIRIFASDIES